MIRAVYPRKNTHVLQAVHWLNTPGGVIASAALKRDVEPRQRSTDLGHPSPRDEADVLRSPSRLRETSKPAAPAPMIIAAAVLVECLWRHAMRNRATDGRLKTLS